MRALFVDANPSLAEVTERLMRPGDPEVAIHRDPDIKAADLPRLLAGYEIAIDDHTQFPTEIVKQCPGLKHIVFLGTGARSYMNPEELEALGVTVHIIKGYGDTAVAEMAFALMWDAARQTAHMDGAIRAGGWPRVVGMQLTGKTIGLIGLGGIGAEMARLCTGIGMKVLAWNRSPKAMPGVEFVELDRLLAESDVVSLHLLLNDETRGFLSRERLAKMKPGSILVNTARGAVVDELALASALEAGHIGHAALDVFTQEPLPAGHPFTRLANVTLTSHAAFRTPEASDNLLGAALDHCRRIVATGK
ncbi:3-phosphoglycerate dehydrogenase [Belnapia sp. T6]|uniref:3-phosphoglycerate dehydrogenase n=1 Tax=Belnapia mucosa TaxID=2804532 RepID=A0ABS1V5I1_9PROT|nr:NAD(P)-dependent oxidoreductase [Belnapia mucosa]MBL6455558.1 3-phosphoglycerate dehydrogenase [Belnapia mucosa]